MSVELIKKIKYKYQQTRKYYVDCDSIAQDPDALDVNTLFQYKNDVHVLKATIKKYLHYPEFNNEIVIKMAKSNKTISNEYNIGKRLKDVPGFIKFICMFQCYDNSGQHTPRKICLSPIKNEEYKKLVILMPYYEYGSIKNYPWTAREINILKSLLKQVVASISTAFVLFGFVHSDLHLDNVLIKGTDDDGIIYSPDLVIHSEGYQIVITDFEMSYIDLPNNSDIRQFFWADLYNLFSRLYEIKTLFPSNLESTLTFLDNAKNSSSAVIVVDHLYTLINNLQFRESGTISIPAYDPNVF